MNPVVIPCLRYTDAPKMIAWLCHAFGFRRHLVVEDAAGGIAHCQLVCDGGMVMLGSHSDDDVLASVCVTPTEAGGNTQSPYIIVADVDALCRQARAAGARILQEPADQDYGGRHFSCLDPEGNLWHFGSYNPWSDGAFIRA